jgi:glucosyl-3-phosphoglycerate synthase
MQAMGDRSASVCVPARNEERTVGAVVGALTADEILVVDDGSSDTTAARAAAAGARVISADDVLVEHAKGPGKGQAMWKGVASVAGDIVVFCDADLARVHPDLVAQLATPLRASDDIVMVKATYTRTLDGRAGEGGRVTELVARPLLASLFPELDHVRQPLAGEYAVRRDVLVDLPFVAGYGVDLALLIDIGTRFGPDRIVQVDLGRRVHRNRPLSELGQQAAEVLQAGLHRAGVPGVAVPECPPLRNLRQ